MYKPPTQQVYGPVINRISDLMIHSNRYAFKGVTRLAKDAGVSPSSVSRIINGKMNPSFWMIDKLTSALERALGFEINPRDLAATMGGFKTLYVCDVVHCDGCLPPSALDEYGNLTPAWEGVLPGTWVTSKYPNGYQPLERKEVA
jgi:transcriptional regulator with XRE-family HTH domain